MRDDLEEMLIALLDNTTDSIDITDSNGIYQLVNLAKAAKRGLPYTKMVGRPISEFMSREDTKKILSDNNKVLTGEIIKDQVEEINYPDGSHAWVSVSKKSFENKNGEKLVISVARDVTTRYAILRAAKHDIRNRIIAIVYILKRLIKGRYEDEQGAYHELLGLIQFVEKIINQYLRKENISISAKKDFDLDTDVIQPILSDLNNLIDENDIHIDNRLGGIPAGEIILTDTEKVVLETIYLNLFENSIRHCGKGIKIAFGFEKTEKFFRLNVYDTGPIIPDENIGKIFEKGFTTGKETTGEGLYNCRELVRQRGGNLIYERTSDGHNNFIILWPRE